MSIKIGSISIVSLLLLNNILTTPAMAAGCNSPLNTTRKIWKKWDETILATSCITTATIVTFGAGTPAASAACIKQSSLFLKAADTMVLAFNALIGDSRLTIGPRPILFNDTQDGGLIGPIDRTFLSAYPMDKNNVTVSVKKLDGRAATEVIICKVATDGTATKVGEINFPRGADNIGQELSKTVTGMENHLLQVRINTITPLFQFKYQLKATK
ncbi:hypothetical protein [Chamaesiphon polymorphus]|uniref:hypothetical protein n=1 Tax=Chamaesiphon polymorphus TaxID=2107691 RepID=UPI0011B25356|nr:hypothetical protein [Chamaesiphon polymorphus]